MVNKAKIEEAVTMLLEAIGEDVSREGLVETPARIARMYEEVFAGMEESSKDFLAKRFHVENNDMVLEKDIVFYSMCEHHLLPFFGEVHVAYIPDGEVVGLSKLARTVEVYAKRPQLQERMTNQIADAIMSELGAKGAMVMIEAEHMCMTMRGIKKPGSKTVTCVKRGQFEKDDALVRDFYQMLHE